MVVLDNKQDQPLHIKIYNLIKNQIAAGDLQPHSKLPSIRNLCSELSVSHNTVEYAYQQLLAEGYVYSKPKSGYYVSLLDSEFAQPLPHHTANLQEKVLQKQSPYSYDFHPASLSPESFPISIWRKLLVECLQEDPRQFAVYGSPQGEFALRNEIRSYLARSRGVICETEQVIICSGLQDSLAIIMPVLRSDHSLLAVEEPGHFIPRSVFQNHSFAITPVPVCTDGLDLKALWSSQSTVVYVTPSHQFPLGHIMPVANRLKLIDWAESVGGVIIEDDYDSELRYQGSPIPALQGLHPEANIVYIGTFSKVLSPALRVSYMVLPKRMLDRYRNLFNESASSASLLEQRVLAKFMVRGHWERHLRKMRTVYKKKHEVLVQAVNRHFGDQAVIIGQGAGLHVVLELLNSEFSEEELIKQALAKNIRLFPLSKTYISHTESDTRQRLIMLGFGGINTTKIDHGIQLLHQTWYK
jgi:GntR family transcriptional regulator/MocR family aminotransferase